MGRRKGACRLKCSVFCQVDPSGVHKLLFEAAAKVTASALLVFSEARAEANGISSVRYTAASQYTANHIQQTDRYNENSSKRRKNTQRHSLQVRSNNVKLRVDTYSLVMGKPLNKIVPNGVKAHVTSFKLGQIMLSYE
jgi:hypothetical protein